jgi:hypothetical protein
MAILSLVVSAFVFAADKPKEEWLFVHTAQEAQATSSTLVMPISRDIFAFTDRPYRKHSYLTGDKFASLWSDSSSDSFKVDPPNAVLTWIAEGVIKEVEEVIANVSSDGKNITYTLKNNHTLNADLKDVSIFVDADSCHYCGYD